MNRTHLPAAAALVLAVAASVPSSAEGPPIDTSFLKRYAETRGFMLGRPTKPKFTPDGKTVLFLRAAGPATPKLTLFEFDVATGKTKELLSPEMLLKGAAENLTPEEKARRERQRVSTGGFADYHLDESGNRVLVMLSGRPWVFDRTTGKARELNAGRGTIVDPKWSPDGKYVSYVRDHDVMAYDLASDKELPVTTGGTAEKTHGLAEFVAQEEIGRHTGYWWSPDSKHIAYEEADHAGVEVWHIADPFKPGVAPQPQFYPRPGKKNVSVRLGIKPLTGGETVWVEWDREKWKYLAAVRWDKVGPLTVQLQQRDQWEEALCAVNPHTGRTELLVRSSSIAKVRQDVPRWLKDGEHFVWRDERAESFVCIVEPTLAWLELRYPVFTRNRHNWIEYDASDVRHAISWPNLQEVISTSAESGDVVVSSHIMLGTDKSKPVVNTTRNAFFHVNLVKLDTDKEPRLRTDAVRLVSGCEEGGIYTAVFDEKHSQYVLNQTKSDQLPISTVRTSDGKPVGALPSVAEEPPFVPNVSVEKVGDYWTAVVRPRSFDPKKKYPVIVDVYGGPHHLHVVQAMRNWLIPQWLADQGFVVVAIDNRGTPGRGRDWERAIYQKFGTVPLDDQVKGLTALCDKFPELDRERVGIVGWSFGGYMAANAVLRRPDVFKAAVAGAPVTDWEDYDTHYTERYLGLLPESRAAYDEASLLPLAKGLSRPLLLVHGTADDNVYYRHSLKLSDALFRAGREFESLPLPGVTHMYSADPQVAERLWERTVRFFKRHLGEAK